MLCRRPTTLTECDEMIVRVSACRCESVEEHEDAVTCSCDDQLAELYAIHGALLNVPKQRTPETRSPPPDLPG